MIAPASTERNEIDLKNGVQFFPVQHIGTFQGLASTMANTYRDYDIALRDSLDNARFMRNDCGVMMALESRMRSVALFPWHIEPENEHSPEQKQLCEEMTKIMDRIPRFVEFRKCLLEAIWFGKYGVQVKYGHDWIGGYRRLTIKSNDGDDCPAWLPVNGDKIVFRHDDASRYENKSGAYPFQVGIRVGVNYKPGEKIMGKYVAESISQSYRGSEPIDRGMAYFLDRNDRQLLVIHKHMIEDGSYEDILSAGSIHGIGIRSRIYWDWVQCRETLGFLIAYLERTHGGIEIYRYPMGNMEAKREVERLITNREPGRGALMVPIPMGEDASQYGVEVTESGMGGIQQMLDLIENYYSTRITKYILGQELSSSAKATGLGSGVADLHLESLLQVLNYDATNLEETMTTQSLRRLQVSNFPASKGINLKFKIDTEDKNQGERLNAINQAFQMGARIKESDVFDVVGLSAPGPNDRVLQAPGGGDGQPSGDTGQLPPSRNSVSVPDDIADMPQRYSNTWSEVDHPRDSDGEFRSKSASASLKKYTEHNPWSGVKNGVSRSVWYAGAVKGEDGVTRATPYEAKLRTMSDNYIDFNTDDPVENWLLAIDEETGSPPVEFTFEVVRDVDNPFGVTGMGSAREVIGKATDYLRHAIYAWSSSVFYFTAAERSRKVLYERLAKFGNEAKSWDGHEYAAYRIDGLGDSHTTFVIAKRDVDIEAITKDYAGESAVVTRLGGDVNRYALSYLTPERYSYAAREPDLKSAIDRAANATDPNPSDAQKVTGNYRKGQFHWNGWTIAIETPAGAKRRGRNALGLEWEHTIPVHYGYFRRTESEADGDHIDVFVGPEPESPVVFVIDQVKGNGHFDEHKVMIGFTSEKDAIDAYRGSYSPGWTGLRSIHGLTVPQFKAWMDEGDSGDPISGQVSKYARQIEFEWKEEDHPRDDVGRFAETESASIAKKPLKPGMVEMRQAKAGGETSEVDGKFTTSTQTPAATVKPKYSAKQLALLSFHKQHGSEKSLADTVKQFKSTDWEDVMANLPPEIANEVQQRVAKKTAEVDAIKEAKRQAAEQAQSDEDRIEGERDRLRGLSQEEVRQEFDSKYGDVSWGGLVKESTIARDSLINEDQLRDFAFQEYEQGFDLDEIVENLVRSLDSDESELQEQEQDDENASEESEKSAEQEAKRKDPEYIRSSLAVYAEFAKRELKTEGLTRQEIRGYEAEIQADILHSQLEQHGWTPDYISSSGSTYYRKGNRRLRVSDHEVPQTAERTHDASHGRFTWAGGGLEIILPVDDLNDLPVDIEK